LADGADARGLKLVGASDRRGRGHSGEGMALIVRGGRRFLFVAHESAPTNFTVLDISDPRRPEVLEQTDLPRPKVRSNSLAIAHDGAVLAVAYQVQEPGERPAGVEFFDISDPLRPQSISYIDTSGPLSVGGGAFRLPVFSRGLLAVTDEALTSDGQDHSTLLWLMDSSVESNLVPIAAAPRHHSKISGLAVAALEPTICTRATPRRRRGTPRMKWWALSPAPGFVSAMSGNHSNRARWRTTFHRLHLVLERVAPRAMTFTSTRTTSSMPWTATPVVSMYCKGVRSCP